MRCSVHGFEKTGNQFLSYVVEQSDRQTEKEIQTYGLHTVRSPYERLWLECGVVSDVRQCDKL